jgi:hypothetical protein
MLVLKGGAVSYERGTPVGGGARHSSSENRNAVSTLSMLGGYEVPWRELC